MHLARLSHRVKPARLLLLRDYDRKRASRPIINQEPPLSFVRTPKCAVPHNQRRRYVWVEMLIVSSSKLLAPYLMFAPSQDRSSQDEI